MRQRKRTLHDEGILTVGVVARTFSERLEVKRPIERLRPFVACANFQRARARAQIARIGCDSRKQLARDAVTAPCGIDPHLEDLHVPVDDPSARVTDELQVRGGVGGRERTFPLVRNASEGFRSAGDSVDRAGAAYFGTQVGGIGRRSGAAGSRSVERFRRLANRRNAIRSPPGAITARKLVCHQALVPGIAAHDARLQGGNLGSMRSIERLVGDARRIGTRVQDGRIVHGRTLVPAQSDVLHARAQILRVVFGQANALVFLRIRKPRVHRQSERRVMPRRVERICLPRPPKRLDGKQEPTPRRLPQFLRENRAKRRKQLLVFDQCIASHMVNHGGVGVGGFYRALCAVRQIFIRNLNRLDNAVRLQTMRTRIVYPVANRIDLFAHRVRRNQQRAAARRPPTRSKQPHPTSRTR